MMAVQETEFTENGFIRQQRGKYIIFCKVECVLDNTNIMQNTGIALGL
jgi:hypothetical protein